jgi:predicted metal-dependent HD superfamily phosphohydrolase
MVPAATTTDPGPSARRLAALPPAMRAALEAAYADPPRAYHDFGHVHEVLGHYDTVAAGPGWMQPDEVFLAVLYHDAIYVPGRRDNEARSAALAVEAIGRWLPGHDIDARRVAALVEATARHGSLQPDEVDREAALFLDCDMAILAATADRFDAYDRGIAREYRGRAPAWLFNFNRRRFLKSLLESPRIFLSNFFHERLDAAARANLRRALDRPRDPVQAGAGR